MPAFIYLFYFKVTSIPKVGLEPHSPKIKSLMPHPASQMPCGPALKKNALNIFNMI